VFFFRMGRFLRVGRGFCVEEEMSEIKSSYK